MAKYKLLPNGVIDTETGACIPNAPGNRDWQDYLEWVADGNTADPEFTPEEIEANDWASIRYDRNLELLESDIYCLQDRWAGLSSREQTDLTNYRQALRDLPQAYATPGEVVWPTKPALVS